jgi:hypothetical protein
MAPGISSRRTLHPCFAHFVKAAHSFLSPMAALIIEGRPEKRRTGTNGQGILVLYPLSYWSTF